MALPASDNFNRADGNLQTGSANWTLVGTGNLAISANEITPARSGNPVLYRWNADTFANDQYAQLTITNVTTNGALGPAARVQTATTGAYFLSTFSGASQSFLMKIINNGAMTQIGSGFTTANGDIIRLEVEGTSLRVYKNTVLQFTQTDSSLATGSGGLFGNDFDDTCTGDNWTAGDLVIYQYARPTGDVSNAGSWTDQSSGTTNLYSFIDETTSDTADYVISPTTPSAATIEFTLTSIPDPAVSTNHVYSFVARKPSVGAPLSLTASLYQGVTLIRSEVVVLTTTFTQYNVTLTGGEADAITNYSDLRLRFSATQDAPAAPTYVGSGTAVWIATGTTALAPQAPAARQAGDTLFLVAHTSTNTSFTDAITGWTKISSTETNTAAQLVEMWYRTADGTATDNPSVVISASSAFVRGARVFAVRGSVGAPTVARSNNAASATVTFPAATSGAISLSVLTYAYEDDPTAVTTLSGFTAFDVDTSTLGTDAAIGMDANRANSGAGSKTGGTVTVSGGTFANSPNVGIHSIFDGGSANVRAIVAWAELKTPEGVGGINGTVVAALQSGTAQSANGIFSIPFILPVEVGSATGTGNDSTLSLGTRMFATEQSSTSSAPNSTVATVAHVIAQAMIMSASDVIDIATFSAGQRLFAEAATGTSTGYNSLFAFTQRFFSEVSSVTSQSPLAALLIGSKYFGETANVTGEASNSSMVLGARILGATGEATGSSPVMGLAYGWTMFGALLAAGDVVDAASFSYAQRFFGATGTVTGESANSEIHLSQRFFGAVSAATGASPNAGTAYGWTMLGALLAAGDVIDAASFQYAQRMFADVTGGSASEPNATFETGTRYYGDSATATSLVPDATISYAQRLISAVLSANAASTEGALFAVANYIAVALLGTATQPDSLFRGGLVVSGDVGVATGTTPNANISQGTHFISETGMASGSIFDALFSYGQRVFGSATTAAGLVPDAAYHAGQILLSEVMVSAGLVPNSQFSPVAKYFAATGVGTATSTDSVLVGLARFLAEVTSGSGSFPVGSWFSGLGISAQPMLATGAVPNAAIQTAYRLTVQLLSATSTSGSSVFGIGARLPGVSSSATGSLFDSTLQTSWRLLAALTGGVAQMPAGFYGTGIGFIGSVMPVDVSNMLSSTLIPIANLHASQSTVSAFSPVGSLTSGVTAFADAMLASAAIHDALLRSGSRIFATIADAEAGTETTDWFVTANVLLQASVANVLASMTVGALHGDVYLGFIKATIHMQKALTKLGVNSAFPGVLEQPISFQTNITAGHYAAKTLTARTEVEEE